MDDPERQSQVLALWFKRPRHKRTNHDVLVFYGELVRTHPQLIPSGEDDPYQQVKVDLRGYLIEP